MDKKRIWVASVLVAVIVAGVVAGYVLYSRSLMGEERAYSVLTKEGLVEVLLEKPLPVLPEEIVNLRIVNRSLTADEARTVGKEVFDLEGTVERWQTAYMVESEKADILHLYDLGGFDWRSYYPGPWVEPSMDEVKPAGEAFLADLRARGLIPTDPLIKIDEGVVSDASTMGGTVEVVYNVKFDELPVGQISVNVACEGKIAGACGHYRNVTPDQNITLMSVEDVLKLLPQRLIDALNQDLQRYSLDRSAYPYVDKITVESAALEYFSWDLSEPQGHMLPIYVFTVKIQWKSPHPAYPQDQVYLWALSATNATSIYGSNLTGIR